MIKNIIFDIGMVLIDFHWAKTMKELDFPDEVVKALGENMVCHSLWGHMDKNDIPENELIEKFKQLSPMYTTYIDEFFDNIEDVVTMFDGADEWLKQLKQKGYNIYLLSNYPERMFKLHTKKFYFLPYTDGRVVSYDCQLVKPDAAIYNLLCERYKLKPEECIFLDDKKENIDAAKKIGFDGIVVDNPFDVRNKLNEYLLDNMMSYVEEFLVENAEEKYSDFSSALVPGCDNMLGVRIPKLRALAKEIAKLDWRSYLANSNDNLFENVMLQGMVIGYAKTNIEETLEYLEKFIPKINNWSVNDCVCASLKTTNKNRQIVWDFLMKYKDEYDEFKQRVVAVMLMDYYLVDDYIDDVFEVWNQLQHPGYYRQMGVAWGVATAYAKYPEKTYAYLKNNNLDDFTYNKAIQKMIESYRVSDEDKKLLRTMKRV